MQGVWNSVRTAVLFGALGAFLVLGCWLSAGRIGLVIGILLAIAVNVFTYFNSDAITLAAVRARPVGEAQAPKLYALVRELATAARVPMPRVYVAPAVQPNAFATGRNPRNSAICVTRGIVDLLDERELRAVLAHELAHVRNRDAVVSCVGAGLFRLAIGRSREYRADETGARLSNDPLALASALRKIADGVTARPLRSTPTLRAAGQLMIASPFGAAHGDALLSTHPQVERRIMRLVHLAKSDPRFRVP